MHHAYQLPRVAAADDDGFSPANCFHGIGKSVDTRHLVADLRKTLLNFLYIVIERKSNRRIGNKKGIHRLIPQKRFDCLLRIIKIGLARHGRIADQ